MVSPRLFPSSERSEPDAGVPGPVPRVSTLSTNRPINAVFIGDNLQESGIVGSLGMRNVSLYIIANEASISRFSRCIAHSLRTQSLGSKRMRADTILKDGINAYWNHNV